MRGITNVVIGMVVGALLCANLSSQGSVFQSQLLVTDGAPTNDVGGTMRASSRASTGTAPTFKPHPMFQAEYDRIDNEDMMKKCDRYRLQYNASAPKRRLFFGSMVADEAIEVLKMHSTEAYGLYDVMVLSESNTTHMATPRDMRFTPGKEGYEFVHTGAFGPDTIIHMTYWLEESAVLEMARERTQRNTIVQGWIDAGMTQDDIGVMADLDETFTRDYLLAMKLCELPKFLLNKDCKTMKGLGDTLVFQSSAECMSEQRWFHPDWTLGHCLEGVGDSSNRAARKRDEELLAKCGGGNNDCPEGRQPYDPDQIKNGLYPLSSGTDLRELPQGSRVAVRKAHNGHSATAFHFHNMFPDLTKLRHKYETYAHGLAGATWMPLGLIEHDLDIVVRCAHDYPNEVNPVGRKRHTEGFENYRGSKPIYFVNATFREERHSALVKMVLEDEQVWGKTYNDTYVSQFNTSR